LALAFFFRIDPPWPTRELAKKESAMETNMEKVAACFFEEEDDSIILSNGLCRIAWTKTGNGWIGQYERFADGQ